MKEIHEAITEATQCIAALVSQNDRLIKLASAQTALVKTASAAPAVQAAPSVPVEALRKAASALDSNNLLDGITTEDLVAAWQSKPETMARTITKLASRFSPESGSSLGKLKGATKSNTGSQTSSLNVWRETMNPNK